ncbi:MAG: carbamoyltransferase HypF [Saprospiraceae bacterium]
METYHIHMNGIVQGVGFRPFIYKLALEMNLNGYIKNQGDGIHIELNASKEKANLFFTRIKNEAPAQSRIISSQLHHVEYKEFTDFSILVEGDSQTKRVLLSPDKTICKECKTELYDVDNRRYRYPFITCTQCGPRYSIIGLLPYERYNTTMDAFHICEICAKEYNTVEDRRFFSQTNSCPACGIKLTLWNKDRKAISTDSNYILEQIKYLLQEGNIIAVKGIGGYHLLCDATNASTVKQLRQLKHRPSKPFAVLYPNIKMISDHFILSAKEWTTLESEESPIVLLKPIQNAESYSLAPGIAPGLNRLGIMLPCSPLLELIVNDFSKPLIATSANISGSPMIYKDEDALDQLFDVASFIISHDRNILMPVDDSVVQLSDSNQEIILRRARGYAPAFLHYTPLSNQSILATGAFLKSSFTLSLYGNVFVSQFLGSSSGYDAQVMYKDTIIHWMNLYETVPELIITDLHPGYFSHQYSLELAKQFNSEVSFVQHHEAHFAAVLAENNLLDSADPILGVIWDGTGLGHDGNIWGGEFFKYENHEMLRSYHFDYFPSIAGDKIALEPRVAAICVAHDVWPSLIDLEEKFTKIEWEVFQRLLQTSSLHSSSVGRIFDAVASLLDIMDIQTYEGEAAMRLQVLAESYVEEHGFEMDEAYFNADSHYYRIPTASLIQGIQQDMLKGKSKKFIAAKFHYSLVYLLDIVATNMNIHKICFSGGVFQNGLLLDWIEKKYSHKYRLFFHQRLPANDENISFGQMVFVDHKIKSLSDVLIKEELYI